MPEEEKQKNQIEKERLPIKSSSRTP